MNRRTFLQTASAGALAPATLVAAGAGAGTPLGYDTYSVRSFGWKAMRLLDYAAELKLEPKTLRAIEEIWPGPGGEAPEAYAW